jgi:hypothetical protein
LTLDKITKPYRVTAACKERCTDYSSQPKGGRELRDSDLVHGDVGIVNINGWLQVLLTAEE